MCCFTACSLVPHCFSPNCTSPNANQFMLGCDRRQAGTPIAFSSLPAANHKVIGSFSQPSGWDLDVAAS